MKTPVLAALFLAFASASYAAEARIASVSGSVETRPSPDAEWVPARENAALGENAEVLTGDNSRCMIQFVRDQDSAVRLEPLTLGKIVSLEPVRIEIKNGRIFALVKNLKKDSTFQVATPTAIASVRGTGWVQSADEVVVMEDSVTVEGAGGGITEVGEGQGLELNDDGTLGASFTPDDETRSEWNAFEAETGGGGTGADIMDDLEDSVAGSDGDLFDAKENLRDIENVPGDGKDEDLPGGTGGTSGTQGGP